MYGNSFNTRKYLERFYDHVFSLDPISASQYIKDTYSIGDSGSFFDAIVSDITKIEKLTPRDVNRLAKLVEAKKFISLEGSLPPRIATLKAFVYQGLVPLFVFTEYRYPERWEEMKETSNLDRFIEYASSISSFGNLASATLSHYVNDWRGAPSNVSDDDKLLLQKELVRLACLYVLDSNSLDPHYEGNLSNVVDDLRMCRIDTTVIRSLDFNRTSN